jgi:uncharacterized protein
MLRHGANGPHCASSVAGEHDPMDNGGMREPSAERIVDVVRRELPEVVAIYLFGSAARGRSREGSDLDIAVLPVEELPSLSRWEAQERIASVLGKSIDLVDLQSASTVLRAQVVATGQLLDDSNPPARKRFEGQALTAYARLNEERREILERIAREGRVLG